MIDDIPVTPDWFLGLDYGYDPDHPEKSMRHTGIVLVRMDGELVVRTDTSDIYDKIIATAERQAEIEHRRDNAANLCERTGEHVRYMQNATCECGEA